MQRRLDPLAQRRKRRFRLARDGGVAAREQPRIAEAAAADHREIRARVAQNMCRVRTGKDVAVCDDGDRHGAFDVADDVPVGASCVHLRAGTAVNRDGRRSGLLADLRKLNCVDAAVIPALAEFDRDGLIHRGHDGLDYPPRKLRRLH